MVSLTGKNPFGKDIELLSWKTWVGLGAFAVVVGGLALGVKWVMASGSKVSNPVDAMWSLIR